MKNSSVSQKDREEGVEEFQQKKKLKKSKSIHRIKVLIASEYFFSVF